MYSDERTGDSARIEMLQNILRILCVLEKELNRVVRRNCYNRDQYPEIFFQAESMIRAMRSWTKSHGFLIGVPVFSRLLAVCIQDIGSLIRDLILVCIPVKGKKGAKRTRLDRDRARIKRSADKMIGRVEKYLAEAETDKKPLEDEFEKALIKSFNAYCSLSHEKEIRFSVSGRGDKSIFFPWSDRAGYRFLVRNKKRFRSEVLENLENYPHSAGHRPTCGCSKKYRLRGFRPTPRKTVMEGGRQQEFPVRMIECADCGQRFSLLPSFLPREKHFGIDIIGRTVQGIALFGHSLNSALEIFKHTGTALKSRQTLLNWLRWFGTLHPAEILTHAGIKGSGYLQEDEGFEKESGMRTYTVAMVDPENFLVWHLDYVDHVDEKTLTDSFEKFIERINFKIIGVTKDKWQPATNALKHVCRRLWIGFCHLHLLKKFRKALSLYQKQTGCSSKETGEHYKKIADILDGAASEASLKIRIGLLKDEAFSHPVLRRELDRIIEDAVHYTCHKRRKGIKKTTSIADNFLKIVKRKLEQVQSFRDCECTGILFRAMANIRNFAPFMSGAKNAHKSPFMIAGGKTFDLSWPQIMNVHNAFLFSENIV